MSAFEIVLFGVVLLLLGGAVVAARGLGAFEVLRSRLAPKKVLVFAGTVTEARAFERECLHAGIPCELAVADDGNTMSAWVPQDRARDARRLRAEGSGD